VVPKTSSRKNSLADVIPDWPELKPFRKKASDVKAGDKSLSKLILKYPPTLIN